MTIRAMSRRLLKQVEARIAEGWSDSQLRTAIFYNFPDMPSEQVDRYIEIGRGLSRSVILSERPSWEPTMLDKPSRAFRAWTRFRLTLPDFAFDVRAMVARSAFARVTGRQSK